MLFSKVPMSTFATQLKSEIARISKKEIKAENAALKKASSQYRSDIAALKRRLAALESVAIQEAMLTMKKGQTHGD